MFRPVAEEATAGLIRKINSQVHPIDNRIAINEDVVDEKDEILSNASWSDNALFICPRNCLKPPN